MCPLERHLHFPKRNVGEELYLPYGTNSLTTSYQVLQYVAVCRGEGLS